MRTEDAVAGGADPGREKERETEEAAGLGAAGYSRGRISL
jgi:hypothetical protein